MKHYFAIELADGRRCQVERRDRTTHLEPSLDQVRHSSRFTSHANFVMDMKTGTILKDRKGRRHSKHRCENWKKVFFTDWQEAEAFIEGKPLPEGW